MSAKRLYNELGLDDLLSSVRQVTNIPGDLIRIGIVGFGVRGTQLSQALGFMEKSKFEKELAEQKESGEESLKSQINQGNLNVASQVSVMYMIFGRKLELPRRSTIFSQEVIWRKNIL